MNCPTCNVALVIAERLNIEIDYCPKCRGVWLDRGELDKILERSEPRGRDRDDDSRRYDEDSRRYAGDSFDRRDGDIPYRKKKREGFLGELFDF